MPEQEQRKRKQGGRGGGRGQGGGEGGDKSNKKAKYYQQTYGGTGQALPIGSHGILVTCDAGREHQAANEAVALIEEHYEKLAAAAPSGGQQPAAAKQEPPADAAAAAAAAEAAEAGDAKPAAAADAATDGGDEGAAAAATAADKDKSAGGAAGGGGSKDIAALLAAEVAELKENKGSRFRTHNTNVKGCVYILFPSEAKAGGPGPVEVAVSIAEEAKERKQVRGRHIVRFLPVTSACFAGLEEVKAAAAKAVAAHFPEGDDATPVEFAVEYEHRSSEGFDRLEVINAFTGAIKTPPHKVNLKTPSLVVLVQMVRNGCGMSVVPKYKELAKLNVRKLAEVEEGA